MLVAIAMTASADSKKVTLKYQSVDCNNNPVTLSACLGLPPSKNTTVKFIVLHNHPTTASNSEVPTGSDPQDQIDVIHSNGLMNDIAGNDGALIVSPDYLGYGETKDHIHPYFASMHTARNCVDAVLAAIDYAKAQGYNIDSNYYTLNAGYSQGGTVTLAVQRYLETIASEDVVKKINLKESYCGAGAYDLSLTFDDWLNSDDIFYPGGLAWILQGMIEAYSEGCMRGIKIEQLLSDDFIKNDLLTYMNKKENKMADVNAKIGKTVGNKDGKTNSRELVSAAMLDPNSPIRRTVQKALDMNNITAGWTPKHKIYLFHWKNDETVTYKNAELIKKLWPDMVVEQNVNPTAVPWSFKDLGTNTMYIAVKGDASHLGYAKRWYIFFYDGRLRDHSMK